MSSRLRSEEREKRGRARYLTTRAIAKGQIVRLSGCEECGSEFCVQAHHDDYDRPYDVRFLCVSCHRVADGTARGMRPALKRRGVSLSDNLWEGVRVESLRTGKSMALIVREAVREHLERNE